ncbi:MAG: hypothetical protein HN790_00640, partial [Methylococcales bacterium]|nr:hypothetical protein [Methylococcales bacterium]
EGRIIDLSYTAAHQLGVLDKGTARVEIKTITPNKPNNMSVAKSTASKMTHTKINPTYIQLGAFSARHNAETLQRRLAKTPQLGDIQINQRKNDPKKLYRVQLGPIKDQQHLNKTQQLLAQQGIPSQLIIPSSPIE